MAPSLGVEVSPINLRDAGEIERAIAAFARSSNGGLIVPTARCVTLHRDLIVTLAARHRLPAVYDRARFVTAGGLMSYGPIASTSTDARRLMSTASSRARSLPTFRCRQPTKYELVINLKTAKALGLDVPPTLLARADEVIE